MSANPHNATSAPSPVPPGPVLRLTEPVEVSARGDAVRDDFLAFGKPVVGQAEMREVAAVLESGWLGTGPKVASFERAFAAYKGSAAERAVGVNSCTAALHLALKLAGIGPGDEVITTPLTFCATVNAILHAGAVPVLADVDPRTQNLDPAAVEAAITPRTAAILPVHFAGRSCDMRALCDIAACHGLELIEDCAHAIETTWHGQASGTFGRFAAFSFYATKNVTTGEGGMLLCRDAKDAERARTLCLHGLSRDAYDRFAPTGRAFRHYQVVEPGYKYNLTDLAAAIGQHQLAKVEEHWWRRHHVWRRYEADLGELPLHLPASPDESPTHRHALHLFSVLVEDASGRDLFLDRMIRQRVGVGVHYLALPEHAWYREHLGWRPEAFPRATDIGRRTVSLPLTAGLTEQDLDDVVRATREACRAG